MTGGFSALPLAEDGGDHDGPHLVGVSKILGPKLLQLPVLTVGLLGVQVLWSVEMSYGAQSMYIISMQTPCRPKSRNTISNIPWFDQILCRYGLSRWANIRTYRSTSHRFVLRTCSGILMNKP